MEERASAREPWLAVNWSFGLPGLGQFLAGRRIRGLVLIGLYAGCLIGGALLVLLPRGDVRVGMVLFLSTAVIGLGALFDAHHVVRQHGDPGFETERRRVKDPWLGYFLSRLFPGIGHAYLGRWGGAVLWILGTLALFVVTSLAVPDSGRYFYLAFSALSVLAGWQVYRSAPVRRESSLRPVQVLSLVVMLLALGQIAVETGLRTRVQAVRMPTTSMEPTFEVGDLMFVARRPGRLPAAGAIAVFRYPRDRTRIFAKRVIGLPGDRIEIRDKAVYVDDRRLDEPYVHLSSARVRPRSYVNPRIYPPGAGNRDNYGPVRVPEGHVFVLGDSRDNSDDSRYFGFVRVGDMIGRVYKIYLPFSRQGPVPVAPRDRSAVRATE
jgi:signal peptidase I